MRTIVDLPREQIEALDRVGRALNESAGDELDLYAEPAISRITWIEILVGAKTEAESRLREKLLAPFKIVELDARIAAWLSTSSGSCASSSVTP